MTSPNQEDRYVSVEQLRQRLSISRSKAYRILDEIGAIRGGRAVRVRLSDVEKWEANNRY